VRLVEAVQAALPQIEGRLRLMEAGLYPVATDDIRDVLGISSRK
jgi:hypothetical protein